MEAQAPDTTEQNDATHHRSFPQDKDGQRSSEMILDPTPPNTNRVPPKEVLSFWEAPRRGVGV